MVWDRVLEPVSGLRTASGTLKLFPAYLKGEDLFGLSTSAVTRIVESVRWPWRCRGRAGGSPCTYTHTHTLTLTHTLMSCIVTWNI